MKKSEIRRSAAESFVNTLSMLRKTSATGVDDKAVESALRMAYETAETRLQQSYTARPSGSPGADAEAAMERVQFLIGVRALLSRAKPKDQHERPA